MVATHIGVLGIFFVVNCSQIIMCLRICFSISVVNCQLDVNRCSTLNRWGGSGGSGYIDLVHKTILEIKHSKR